MKSFLKDKYLILFFTLISILLIFFHYQPLSSYFSQDDFFHLRVVMDKTYYNIPSFFLSLQKEYAFYRPLSRETFNLLMYQGFGLNPFSFHLVNLFLIILNILTLFFIAKKLFKGFITPIFAVLLYSFNSIHSIELYYLASVQTLLATTFLLLSILYYFSHPKNLKNYFLSLVFFVLGLLSHEISIVLIGIIFSFEAITNKMKFWDKKLIIRLLPYILIGGFYLLNTSLFDRLPNQQVYKPVLSVKSIFNTLSWYTLWDAGLPELLVDFIGPKFTINPNLIKWYGDYLKIVLPIFSFWVISLGIIAVAFRKKILKDKVFWILVFSYLFSLSPFLLFPQHKSSYYLTFASIWFSLIMAFILSFAWETKKFPKIWIAGIIFAFIFVSYQTTQLNKLTYWAAKRGNAAESLLTDIQKLYPTVPKGAVFYLKNDPGYPLIAKEWGNSSKQAFYILSGSDALKLLYKDPTIKVYFEDMGELPDNSDKSQVIYHMAKFPY